MASLKNGGYAKELEAGSLLEIALDKLPPELQSKWGRKIIKSHLIALSLQDFSAWLHDIFKAEIVVKHGKLLSQPNKSVAGLKKPGQQRGGRRRPAHRLQLLRQRIRKLKSRVAATFPQNRATFRIRKGAHYAIMAIH